MDTPYILGRQYHVDINDIRKLIYASGNEHLIVNITEGLHSYTSIDVAMRLNSTDNLCFSAIIPAGATVVEGDKGNIVSTDLIVQPYYYVPVKIKGRILFYRKKKWNVKY